ncbi:hypothetical protein Taro_013527, partial [Colocasia esculenta]|nr:hypothetical protein [Colocasia esculenta]
EEAKEEESEEKVKSEEHTKEEAKKEEESKDEAKSEEHTKEVVEKEDDGKLEERTKEVAEKETDIALWGVPLLGSKGSQGIDVILLKFLRAREFKAKEAFEMLRSTLQWRKDARIDSILEEESLGEGLEAAAYMDGADREGHPVCYNVYGVFQDSALYEKAFGSEEKVERFLRWRFQLMEKGIQKLGLRPGGVASMLQITDLKDSPGVSKREIRAAMKRAVGLLQDNYPEFVAKNIFINVPFWYYAFNSLLSPFLTQRTKSKFVFARPARVTETLLKYVPAEDIPVRYGGLKRENDTEFSVEDGAVSELIIKSGATENVEIPIPEAGTTVVWDLTVVGWEVNYKEEFVPTDEASYTVLLQKGKKMGPVEQAVRNSFRNNEPGKVVLIIENNTFWKKKVLYRYKTKSSP